MTMVELPDDSGCVDWTINEWVDHLQLIGGETAPTGALLVHLACLPGGRRAERRIECAMICRAVVEWRYAGVPEEAILDRVSGAAHAADIVEIGCELDDVPDLIARWRDWGYTDDAIIERIIGVLEIGRRRRRRQDDQDQERTVLQNALVKLRQGA